MTTTPLAELPYRFFGGQDQLKGPLPPDLCGLDYRAEIAGFPAMDAAGHGEFGRAFYAAFPDLFHTIEDVVAAGDRVAARFTLRGTHRGAFFGVPPTGRAIALSAFVILTVDDGGRVAHLQGLFDRCGLLEQLGALQSGG
jgi:predicted ester cyclase